MWPPFLRLWLALSGNTPRRAKRRRRPAFRLQGLPPRLEALEDRTVPTSLGYSTYLPGPTWATTTDSSGNVYVTGNGNSSGTSNAYVAKVNATGTGLDWLTTLSSSESLGTGIAVDANGNVYVSGQGSVPATANALGTSGEDFCTVLNPSGSVLYSTQLPGSTAGNFGDEGTPYGAKIALAPSGTGPLDNAYLTGEAGAGLPTTAGAYQTNSGGGNDAFFLDVNPNLSGSAGLVYGSYLGGSGNDVGTGIAADASGNAYIAGATYSTNFPTTPGAYQQASGGSEDAFVAKFNPSLSGSSSLVYSTYLGGSGFDGYYTDSTSALSPAEPGPAIAVDPSGDAYVAGGTSSTNFPTTPGAYQTSLQGKADAFVTKLNATGSGLVYSTYLGGSNNFNGWAATSGAFGIAVDASGNADVTGWARSTNFPTVNALQTTNAGGSDAFVTTLNSAGSGLLSSTYFGGSADDFGYGVALDSSGNAYVVGKTASTNFPTTPGALQTTPGTGFLFQIEQPAGSGTFAISGPSSLTAGTTGNFSVTALNPDGTVNTGYSGTVSISSSDPKAVLPGNIAVSNGTATFTATLETAGTQSVTATDVNNPAMTGSDTSIAVTPAAASQVVFTQVPSSGTAGKTLGTVQVALEDAYGNIETADNSDQVTLSVNGGPSTQMGGTLTATVQSGSATFSNLVLDTSGSYTLAAQGNLAGGGTLGPAVSSGIAVASPVSVKLGSITYNSKTGLYSETATLTNTTSGTLTGPMSLELTNLPSGVVLTDATGTTNGNPYERFLASGKTLKKGASTSTTLTFTAPSQSDITFGTEVVVGL
jgi:hypothetical protein